MPNKSISVSTPEDEELWPRGENAAKRGRFGSMSSFVLWAVEQACERVEAADRVTRFVQLPVQPGRTVRITATDADGNPTGEVMTLRLTSSHFVCEHWETGGSEDAPTDLGTYSIRKEPS